MPGRTYPAAVKDQALDLIAAEAAANDGKVPRGCYSRIGEAVGAPWRTVWGWWNEQQGEEDQEQRTTDHARARERLRQKAMDAADELLDRLLDKSRADELSERTETNLLGVCQRIADGNKDAPDLLQNINLLVNDRDREIPEELPPPPDLDG